MNVPEIPPNIDIRQVVAAAGLAHIDILTSIHGALKTIQSILFVGVVVLSVQSGIALYECIEKYKKEHPEHESKGGPQE